MKKIIRVLILLSLYMACDRLDSSENLENNNIAEIVANLGANGNLLDVCIISSKKVSHYIILEQAKDWRFGLEYIDIWGLENLKIQVKELHGKIIFEPKNKHTKK